MDVVDLTGTENVELASEPLLACESLLMASLVTTDHGFAVELGRRPVTEEGVHPAYKPVRLDLGALPRVRRMAEDAAILVPGMVLAWGDMMLLAEDGDLDATVSCSKGELPWFSLVQGGGEGLVTMPAREADALARLLRDTERQLADRGLAALDRSLAH
jgi:hypothetical protein